MCATLGRIVNDYQGLIEICRQRAEELAISREGIDDLTGLADGYTGKLLGKRLRKTLGPLSLGPMLNVLGLKMLIIEDDVGTARTLSRREPVDRANQRFENSCNSPKQLPAPKRSKPMLIPAATNEAAKLNPSRAHLRVVQSKRPSRSKYG